LGILGDLKNPVKRSLKIVTWAAKFIADSSLSVIVMSGIAHPTGGANRQMERTRRQQGGGATQQRGPVVVSIVVTGLALAGVIAHLIWSDLAIDAIALALVGIAILPWLGPILESIELPGGFKANFREVQQTIQDVKETTEEALSETKAVKDTAQEALSETKACKDTAQAALSRTEEIDKKVSELPL
jgi:ABC-type multidrug transport system fused ATPase/permease subunit